MTLVNPCLQVQKREMERFRYRNLTRSLERCPGSDLKVEPLRGKWLSWGRSCELLAHFEVATPRGPAPGKVLGSASQRRAIFSVSATERALFLVDFPSARGCFAQCFCNASWPVQRAPKHQGLEVLSRDQTAQTVHAPRLLLTRVSSWMPPATCGVLLRATCAVMLRHLLERRQQEVVKPREYCAAAGCEGTLGKHFLSAFVLRS